MRRFRRKILTAAALCAGVALAGCSSLGSLDPTTWFDNKKPIPGERKMVFPEGVPGVPQGVPSELVQGNQPAADPAMIAAADASKPAGGAQAAAPAAATAAPAAAKSAARPRPKVATRKARPKAKQDPVRVAPASPEAPPTQVTVQPTRPQPASTDSSVWGPAPGQGAAAPWPAPTTRRAPGDVWPEPPTPNTFSR